jgi:hypothetical protein
LLQRKGKPARQKCAEKLQLVLEDLFGIDVDVPDSITTKTTEEVAKEGGSQGFFRLLHRASRDGIGSDVFHSKCDNEV